MPQPRLDIALARRGGRVFAFNNHCPHNRLPFFGKEIPDGGPLLATPASSDLPEPCRIECRFHGSVFDLDTGSIVTWCPKLAADGTAKGVEILGDLSKNEAPLEVYRVSEASGTIWVEMD